MIDIDYSARIKEHSGDNLSMLVEFVRPGYTTVTVGVILPPEGTDLATHLEPYAPTGAWDYEDAKKVKRVKPAPGTTVVYAKARPKIEAPIAPLTP